MKSLARNLLARTILLFVLAGVLIWLAFLADGWAFSYFNFPRVYDHDWGRMLRIVGFLPVWLVVGAALLLCDRPLPDSPRRGLLLIAATTLGGIAAELLKLLIRRQRPEDGGISVYRDWADRPFATNGLAMPSGHVFVAFAAATMLTRFWPRARFIWYGLAVGCAVSRLFVHAHFLSDVVVAAIGGYAVSSLVWRVAAWRGEKRAEEAHPELQLFKRRG